MKLTKIQFALSLSLAICYLLFLVSYIVISIATLSPTYNLVPLAFMLCSLFAIGILFYLQIKMRKRALSLSAFIASFTITLIYFIWFIMVDSQNLNAMFIRISGNASTQATIGDYFACYFLLIEAILMILIVVLSTLTFFLLSKQEVAKKKPFVD